MKYSFYNLAGDKIWEYTDPIATGDDSETVEAIQKLFSSFPTPPPVEVLRKTGTSHDGLEQWSVGPFDVKIKKEEE